jgi:hypothetical protein
MLNTGRKLKMQKHKTLLTYTHAELARAVVRHFILLPSNLHHLNRFLGHLLPNVVAKACYRRPIHTRIKDLFRDMGTAFGREGWVGSIA